MRNDAIDLRTEWLDGDYEGLAVERWVGQSNLHGLHLKPICKSASSTDSAWYSVALAVEANDCVSW